MRPKTSNPTPENSRIYRFGERVCLANADTVRTAVGELLDTAGVRRLTLDAESVCECDSHGIHLFLTIARKAADRGIQLLLYRPSATVRDALEAVGFLTAFTVVETLER
ncbi:MAG: STAS domain-containing protein [Chitinivibrionales bacterium]|nr:STAS domain-containing protein [Chitinivibrionales bacterium]MBD3357003.1 STAS domain-containing protein [Chitinivibrionales bacterium]